jgi:hypothetical protein
MLRSNELITTFSKKWTLLDIQFLIVRLSLKTASHCRTRQLSIATKLKLQASLVPALNLPFIHKLANIITMMRLLLDLENRLY